MFHFFDDFGTVNYADHFKTYCADKSAEFIVSNLE